MKLLAVGNSFSQDACTFLHQTAQAQGLDLEVTNLYIGGCSLEMHYQNLLSGKADYQCQQNGQFDGRMISLPEALAMEPWDVIVTQQASHFSGWMDSYEPFLMELLAAFRKACPQARLYLHETWAYERGSDHGAFFRYHRDQMEMYDRLRYCYRTMARQHGLSLIPSGDVIQRARTKEPFRVQDGGRSLCRDGFHMSLSYGRYLLACVWVGRLFHVSMADNPFIPDGDEAVEPALLALLQQTADEVLAEQRSQE